MFALFTTFQTNVADPDLFGGVFVNKFLEETWPKIYFGQDPDQVKKRPDQHCFKQILQ
jgi:hypothetical protein